LRHITTDAAQLIVLTVLPLLCVVQTAPSYRSKCYCSSCRVSVRW